MARGALTRAALYADSVSKRFSMPGVRVGAVVSYNSEVMESILKFAQARLSVGTLEQYALIPGKGSSPAGLCYMSAMADAKL